MGKKGVPLTEEHRRKIGLAQLGKTLSEEHKAKMRKPKNLTEEQREYRRRIRANQTDPNEAKWATLGLSRELIAQKKAEGLYFCKSHKEFLPLDCFVPSLDEFLCRVCKRCRSHHTTLEWYSRQFELQYGDCAICKTPLFESAIPCIDHDHACCAGETS